MGEALPEAEPIHAMQTRALIYVWDHPAVAAACRMDRQAQQARCAAWAAARGWPVVGVLVDEGSNGARPALAQIRVAAQERRCEVIVIPVLASFGPRVEDVLALLEALASQGVDLVSLHEAFDTTSAHGSFAMLVVHALAQIAGSAAPEPRMAAPAAAPATPRAKRRRSELPFGYHHTDHGVAVDPATAPIVRRIFMLHAAGATTSELVQLLRAQGGGRWNQRALAAVLADEDAYRGGPHPDGGRWPALLERQ